MIVEVIKIPLSEKHVMQNLVKMYCYEWTQYNNFDVNDKGEYEFESHISNFWDRENHFPFFIKVDGILAGFILINDEFEFHKNYDYAISEFFVMFKYRRGGVGRQAAKAVFDMFHGKWEIVRHPGNLSSVNFWDNVVDQYSNGRYQVIKSCQEVVYNDGTYADIISFEN